MAVLAVLAVCVLALVVVLAVGDVRSGGVVRRRTRSAELTRRTPVPSGASQITGTTVSGTPTSVVLTGIGVPTLLVFLGSTCVSCRDLWRGARQAVRGARPLRIVIVTRGPVAESAASIAQRAGDLESVVMSDHAWEQYGVTGAPAFVLVDDRDGTGTRLDSEPDWSAALDDARRIATRTIR